MSRKNQEIVTLYGNLGADPKVHEVEACETTRNVYDPILDDVVEKSFVRPARTFRTFSLAINKDEVTRWHPCVDWKNLSSIFRKGDRVRLTGYFELRTFEKDGETQRLRQFVVTAAGLEKAKIRHDSDQ